MVSFIDMLLSCLLCLLSRIAPVASNAFDEVKQDCKQMVEVARKKIDDLDDELRRTFEEMEGVC